MTCSFVLATVGRADPVGLWLESLASQNEPGVEVILADQNDDDRVAAIAAKWRAAFPIVHLRTPLGLSRSRNAALPHARGAIIAFPDDDCVYPPGLLAAVRAWFHAHPDRDGVSGMAVTPEGKPNALRWSRRAGPLTRRGIWFQAISYTIFLRRTVVDRTGRFDETLGVGASTPWGAGEETDYLLRALAAGCRLHYDPALRVAHPAPQDRWQAEGRRKAYSYGLGMGRVLALHRFPLADKLIYCARPAAGALWHGLRGEWDAAACRAATAKGRCLGILSESSWCRDWVARNIRSGG